MLMEGIWRWVLRSMLTVILLPLIGLLSLAVLSVPRV